MFERFTDRARRVVVQAQEEARRLDHGYIGTEHLLLALVDEGGGVAAKALEQLGISADDVRRQVDKIVGPGQGSPAPGKHIPYTPRSKKVFELSLREALDLGHNYIGTEHILLGLVREGSGGAAQVLDRLGLEPAAVRSTVMGLLTGAEPTPSGRHLRLRVSSGRIDLTVHDPDLGDLPELELVVRSNEEPPSGSRAIYATVREIMRRLDVRLAQLEAEVDRTAE